MPSNYTEHYQLSQWERTDKVLMEDFNGDNAKLDAALKAQADALAGLSEAADSHAASLAQHNSAIARLGTCAVYTTSYTGNDGSSRSYSFPGYPVFVYIRNPAADQPFPFLRGMSDSMATSYNARWSSRGLSLNAGGSRAGFNFSGTTYHVMALLDMSK